MWSISKFSDTRTDLITISSSQKRSNDSQLTLLTTCVMIKDTEQDEGMNDDTRDSRRVGETIRSGGALFLKD